MQIFLIGFMGTGKSYWGRRWTERYGFDFFDLDRMIETELKKSIADIFEEDGEDIFRQTESKLLRKFSGKDNFIVACGGGAACFNDNMQWMNENGITVHLSASAGYIYNRLQEEKDKRPLIKRLNEQELLFFIEQKLKEREPFYGQAKIILPVEEITDETVPEFLNDNS